MYNWWPQLRETIKTTFFPTQRGRDKCNRIDVHWGCCTPSMTIRIFHVRSKVTDFGNEQPLNVALHPKKH
jgi:hypothetical protein